VLLARLLVFIFQDESLARARRYNLFCASAGGRRHRLRLRVGLGARRSHNDGRGVVHARLLVLLHFDLPHELIKVLFIVNIALKSLHKRQDELVKEDPLVLEELVQEVAHVVARDHRGKQAKNPLASVHI